MSDAVISRVLKDCNVSIEQTTGTSTTSVMSQNASTNNFASKTHSHVVSDLISGTLSVSMGGTGKTSLTSGAILLGNGTSAISSTSILGVSKGGTGQSSLTSGAILLGNGTNGISTTSVLAQSKGGTGSTSFYEKGSWTPSIASSGSTAPSVSYSYRYGVYYRIGNLVFIACHISMSISSVGSNYACIKGLPYTCAGGSDKYGLSLIEEFYATNTGEGDPRGFVVQGTTRIDLRGHSGAVANTWITGSNQYIGYSGCYIKS